MVQITRMMGAMMRCFAHEIGIIPSIVCPTLRYIIHNATARQSSRPTLPSVPHYFRTPEIEGFIVVTL